MIKLSEQDAELIKAELYYLLETLEHGIDKTFIEQHKKRTKQLVGVLLEALEK